MLNRSRLRKELLPILESIYKDYWQIRNEILHGEDKAFNVIANLEQMKSDIKRTVALAREIES